MLVNPNTITCVGFSFSDCVVNRLSEPSAIGTNGEVEETEDNIPKETSGNSSFPSGFTVLGGFENKPVQKVQ